MVLHCCVQGAISQEGSWLSMCMILLLLLLPGCHGGA